MTSVRDAQTGLDYLLQRFGKTHLRRRLGVETEHEADRFGQGRNFFHIENWRTFATLVRTALWITGTAARGRRNMLDIRVRENRVVLPGLPPDFDGYTLLQLSDLHLDALPEFPHRLAEVVRDLEYDVCVLTGDYRFSTTGPWEPAMEGLRVVRAQLRGPVFAVLGNHDSLFMSETIERMEIRLLLNEAVRLNRGKDAIHLAGVDDPHYFEADDLPAAVASIPEGATSVLLSHSPEIFKHAAYTGFDLMLCGHTHGGQICLPGGRALTYNAATPRALGVGRWSYHTMQGYTSAGTGSSVVPARFNCPPEVTLHRLQCSG